MSTVRADYDHWITGKDTGKAVEDPAWEEVKQMILALDGWERTLVTFGNYEEGCYMAVGGGKNGTYIAYISYDDEERLYHLTDPNGDGTGWEELVVGGQRGRFPADTCVSQKMVLRAAKRFFETQELDPDMRWEE